MVYNYSSSSSYCIIETDSGPSLGPRGTPLFIQLFLFFLLLIFYPLDTNSQWHFALFLKRSSHEGVVHHLIPGSEAPPPALLNLDASRAQISAFHLPPPSFLPG